MADSGTGDVAWNSRTFMDVVTWDGIWDHLCMLFSEKRASAGAVSDSGICDSLVSVPELIKVYSGGRQNEET